VTQPYLDQETEDSLFRTVAARKVQDLAPVPDPEPTDYAPLAAAAEYLVYNYLTQTSGASVSSEGVSGISSSYVDLSKIEAIVAPVMGEYFVGSTANAASNTAYLEDFS
jgi:hypothetical protein